MKALLVLAVLPCLASPCSAGAFDARSVPADARWVAHVDLEALGRSLLLSTLRENGHDLTREFDFDQIEHDFGVDPLVDLASMTFFDAGAGPKDFVAVLRARPSVETAFARIVERAPPAARMGERNVYALGADKHALLAAMIAGPASAGQASAGQASAGPASVGRTIVLGTNAAAVARGLALLDGSLPNLADARAPALVARPSAGTIYFATGSRAARRSVFFGVALGMLRELADLERGPTEALEARAQSLTFEIGEEHDAFFTKLELEGENAQAASEMAQVLCDSLARLTKNAAGTAAAPRIERITRALHIDTSAARVLASFRYDIRAFVEDVLRSEEALGIGAEPR